MLKTNLCGIDLKNPLILGSGTIGESKEALIKCMEYGAAGVVNRTVRLDNTKRTPFKKPYHIEPGFMLNADNNNRTPWRYWLSHSKEIGDKGAFFLSISARYPDDCRTIIPEFEDACPPTFYELNFSCSHSAKMYGRIGYDSAERALRNIKEYSRRPVLLKLSLDSIDYRILKKFESDNLVDGYVLSNTIGPGLKVNIQTRGPELSSVFGGLSGSAIKPLVLAGIYNLRKNTDKPIVGVGGIETAEDVLEYLILGCDAVQIYTAAHRRGLKVFSEINSDLASALKDMGETVESIKGTFRESNT